MASKPMPHHFTILARGIPVRSGASISNTVEKFFIDYYPSTYLSHIIVRQTSKLRHLIVSQLTQYNFLCASGKIPEYHIYLCK
jgi:calcium permeable stress-gated cation channel